MLRVGLTGGLATGKSMVAAWLAELGCLVIGLDDLGHQVLEPGGEAYQEVAEAFGPDILKPDGTIDRRGLGERVFADPAALARLSAIVHPHVHARALALGEAYAAAHPEGIVVEEAAILIETGSYTQYDRLIVVTCLREQQMERAMARGLTRQQAEDRLARQLPLSEKVTFADYLIDTSGTIEQARESTRRVYARLKRDAQALA